MFVAFWLEASFSYQKSTVFLRYIVVYCSRNLCTFWRYMLLPSSV